jgi:hypothetical protein
VPLMTRRGDQIKGQRRQRIMMPVCDTCNATMNVLIEVPARPIVERLALDGWRGEYSEEQWRSVGLWWAKVLLLIGHPDSVMENARLQGLVKLNFDSKPDVRWLTDGSGVPEHVSVFVYNADYSRTGTAHELVVPANVVLGGGKTFAQCHVLAMATSGLAVAVVSHPGVTVGHPLVASGQAWELLRSPPLRGDIGALNPLPRDYVRYLRGGGVDEGHVVDGSEVSSLTALFGSHADRLPPEPPR